MSERRSLPRILESLGELKEEVLEAILGALGPLDPRRVALEELYRFRVGGDEPRLEGLEGIEEKLKADSILVVGVGNPLFGDDGVGYCLVEALRSCGRVQARVMTVQSLDPGLAAYLEGRDYVVFVDAIDPRELPEGASIAVYEVEPSRLEPSEVLEALSGSSSHQLDPVTVTLLAYAAGGFRGRAYIVGVRVERVELGAGLSDTAVESALRALDALVELLEKLGVRVDVDRECVREQMVKACETGVEPRGRD